MDAIILQMQAPMNLGIPAQICEECTEEFWVVLIMFLYIVQDDLKTGHCHIFKLDLHLWGIHSSFNSAKV